MRKRLLFICSSLDGGGVSKSLVSLLSCLDYSRYEADLLLFAHGGLFYSLLPKEVHVLPQHLPLNLFSPAPLALKSLLHQKEFAWAARRLFHAVLSLCDRGAAAAWIAKQLPTLPGIYDAAIDFNGQHVLYFMIEKVSAKNKFSFFHSDYKKWPHYYRADKYYFAQADAVITVSELCLRSLQEVFPEHRKKFHMMHNIVSPGSIRQLARNGHGFADAAFKGTRILTIGHPCSRKGTDLAIEACAKLVSEGYDIRWHILGDSTEVIKYRRIVEARGLIDRFIFHGALLNPYPYLSQTDIYCHPARFEGKPLAVDEAKVLARAIVVTNFSTAPDQISHERNGLIVDLSAEAICSGIKRLIDNPALRETFSRNLQEECTGNEAEVLKLYELIERDSECA
ncbi:MAG TPA: glycosyltransferase [Oligoflexia bacterium]|nr:glycosyltransferase [Oligoflexia bacterium]